MYDWLHDALHEHSFVVTANRRLARVLVDAHAQQQLEAGQLAWRSPNIVAWADWLTHLYERIETDQNPPLRINEDQSRVLWERCLRREVSDPLLNVSMLTRQAQDAWTRLHDWCVPLQECVAAAAGRDQKIFASAAANYAAILDQESWIDSAGLAGLVTRQLRNERLQLTEAVTLAGFDRYSPAVDALLGALQECGVRISRIAPDRARPPGRIVGYENAEAELRAAGAWAREQSHTDRHVAIVRTSLEQDAEWAERLVREGLAPGWQSAGVRYRTVVNVSYGRRLIEYPLVAIAFAVLQWCTSDISSQALSRLLRFPTIGHSPVVGRSGLELMLRQMPARLWSPSMVLRAFSGASHCGADARDFLQRVDRIRDARRALSERGTPAEWAASFDDLLSKLHWPGDASLSSREYQLVNRWRELLNEFARLELVLPSLTFTQALGRLRTMATETVFQPESEGAIVQLLGPLEAAGMQFDALWVAGMTADNWPPAGRPSPLLSRQLQRDHAMPDADPSDTLGYAERVLTRLAASAPNIVYSYARTDGDAEKSASELLQRFASEDQTEPDDPGWYAARISGAGETHLVRDDPVPTVGAQETVSGGAATIQRQSVEPFSAFAYGRLGIRPLYSIPTGLPPNIRGSLMHSALHHLYRQFNGWRDIESQSKNEIETNVSTSLFKAFDKMEATADDVLRKLLRLENERMRNLLSAVIGLDLERQAFDIVALEAAFDVCICGVSFALRIDRIDRAATGQLQLIDYKTGQYRQFLGADDEPNDIQLVVYAMAVEENVGDLAYINIDSRDVGMSGAGMTLTPDLEWPETLRRWSREVEAVVQELASGDVRLLAPHSTTSGRGLGLLSRIRELQRSGR